MTQSQRITIYVLIGVLIMIILGRRLVPKYVQDMALAIMNFEGYYDGSRSQRNNNPGNLRWFGDKIPWHGAVGVDETHHVIFDTFENGWNGLIKQLKLAFENRSRVYSDKDTLFSFFGKYAEANTNQYANYVALQLQVTPDTTLAEIRSA